MAHNKKYYHKQEPGARRNGQIADSEVSANQATTDEMEELVPEDADSSQDEPIKEESLEKEVESLKAAVDKEKKEYLFLMAEFDNFRKRTLKEKSELIKNAGEQVFKGLLPIVDDFERGLDAAKKTDNVESVIEGMELIYSKLVKFLEQNGVKPINEEDKEFDTERHEAITAVPVSDESLKGKIIDTVEKGYTINDKVLRHAKVVVGQ